jgi:hypothetical protein
LANRKGKKSFFEPGSRRRRLTSGDCGSTANQSNDASAYVVIILLQPFRSPVNRESRTVFVSKRIGLSES